MHPCRPQTQTLQSLSRRTIAFDGLAEPDAGDGRLSRRLCVMTRHLGGRVQRAGELMGEGGHRIVAMPPIWELRSQFTASCSREPRRPYSRMISPAAYSFETGRFVHGSVKTVVGQHSRPVSMAARSLRQNSSSCFWRRARASTLPSSMTRFRFEMMPPPTIRVSVTL